MNIRVGILTAPHIDYEQGTKSFVLHNVRIGIGFHWDRYEDQEFAGQLEVIRNADGTETAVNIIDLEDYLCSVISSEMSANSPMELLKAHAVISRSWALRAIEANRVTAGKIQSSVYEQNGHIGFDVCADDHCQRYEGLGRMNNRAVEAVRATKGEVLSYGDEICDCRFHKCCGGKTEEFETCWEDKHVPYLESVDCPWKVRDTSLYRPLRVRQSIGKPIMCPHHERRRASPWVVRHASIARTTNVRCSNRQTTERRREHSAPLFPHGASPYLARFKSV